MTAWFPYFISILLSKCSTAPKKNNQNESITMSTYSQYTACTCILSCSNSCSIQNSNRVSLIFSALGQVVPDHRSPPNEMKNVNWANSCLNKLNASCDKAILRGNNFLFQFVRCNHLLWRERREKQEKDINSEKAIRIRIVCMLFLSPYTHRPTHISKSYLEDEMKIIWKRTEIPFFVALDA